MKLVIQRYTREAGVRNLERSLASLARAAAVMMAEQECMVQVSKDSHRPTTSLLDTGLADSAEVEMEVITMDSRHNEINSFPSTSTLVVDEVILEKVLGVIHYCCWLILMETFLGDLYTYHSKLCYVHI